MQQILYHLRQYDYQKLSIQEYADHRRALKFSSTECKSLSIVDADGLTVPDVSASRVVIEGD